jgi:hypothetical protein
MKRALEVNVGKDIKHVLFVIAMEAEAKPFLEAMDLPEVEHAHAALSMQLYQGVYVLLLHLLLPLLSPRHMNISQDMYVRVPRDPLPFSPSTPPFVPPHASPTHRYKELKLSVVVNGKCSRFGVDNVGTTPAALSTYLAITQMNPDLVINAGTAGGFKSKVIILLIRTVTALS